MRHRNPWAPSRKTGANARSPLRRRSARNAAARRTRHGVRSAYGMPSNGWFPQFRPLPRRPARHWLIPGQWVEGSSPSRIAAENRNGAKHLSHHLLLRSSAMATSWQTIGKHSRPAFCRQPAACVTAVTVAAWQRCRERGWWTMPEPLAEVAPSAAADGLPYPAAAGPAAARETSAIGIPPGKFRFVTNAEFEDSRTGNAAEARDPGDDCEAPPRSHRALPQRCQRVAPLPGVVAGSSHLGPSRPPPGPCGASGVPPDRSARATLRPAIPRKRETSDRSKSGPRPCASLIDPRSRSG